MARTTCFVSDLCPPSTTPAITDLRLGGQAVDQILSAASANASGDAIDLKLDWSRLNVVKRLSTYSVGDDDLYQALSQLLPQGSGSSIGLLIANSYSSTSNALGAMFDLDASTSGYGPRQGCALFLSSMLTTSGTVSDAEFREFVAYVAVHELGHAFNLWHVNTPRSFMYHSTDPSALTAQSFVDEHKSYLASADGPDAAYVIPGGSAFGTRGPLAPPDGDDGSYLAVPATKAVRLNLEGNVAGHSA